MPESLSSSSASPADDSAWFTAHCDGGSRGNPGPAAYGAVIEDSQGRVVARLSEYLGRQTNNYAEYQGLLAVLAWAAEQDARRLQVVSDSELIVRQMSGRYKVSSPALRPLWEEARRRVALLDAFKIRHTLRAGNREADRLANEAMDHGMGRGPNPNSDPSPVPNPLRENSTPAGQPQPQPSRPPKPIEGYVKNGVVHLLDGELPEGAFVKIIPQ